MGWIGCIRCEKFWCNFMGRTSALVAPVQPVLHWVLCSNETIQNASKHYETHQNMSLGPNGVDREHSLQKILIHLCGTNFCTISARFAPCLIRQPNGPKCTQIVQNTPKHQFRVQWGGLGLFVAKNSDTTSWQELLHFLGPFCTEIRKATKRSRMVWNTPIR